MLRARRLKQIAESNKPVFSSSETEWWLAEAPARQETAARNVPEKSVKAAELKKEIPPSSNASAQDAAAEEPAAAGAKLTFDFLKEPEPIQSTSSYEFVREAEPQAVRGFAKKEELTWDAKMSCFVMSY